MTRSSLSDPARTRSRLRCTPPLAAEELFGFLGARTIPGVEVFDGRTFRRSVRVDDAAAIVSLSPDDAGTSVELEIDATDAASVAERAGRLLDVETDPGPIEAVLAADPELRPLVRARPGVRVPGTVDGFELAVRAVLGQQISVKGARTIAGRIVAVTGTVLAPDEAVEGVTHLFPTPEQLAAASLDGLGLTGARISTLRRLAELAATKELDLSGRTSAEVALDRLRSIPGIGPWTTAYVAMRAFHDADAFPADDLGIRAGMAALGMPTTRAAIRDRAERWRPWRAYAAMHLWLAPHTT